MFAEKRDVNSAHNQIVSVSIENLDVVALFHLGKKPCGKWTKSGRISRRKSIEESREMDGESNVESPGKNSL